MNQVKNLYLSFIVLLLMSCTHIQPINKETAFISVPIKEVCFQDSNKRIDSIVVSQDTVSMAIKVKIGPEKYSVEPIFSSMKQTPVFKLKQIKNKWFLLVYTFDYFKGNCYDNLQIMELYNRLSSYKCGFINMPKEVNGKMYSIEERFANDTLWVKYNYSDSLNIKRIDYCVLD